MSTFLVCGLRRPTTGAATADDERVSRKYCRPARHASEFPRSLACPGSIRNLGEDEFVVAPVICSPRLDNRVGPAGDVLYPDSSTGPGYVAKHRLIRLSVLFTKTITQKADQRAMRKTSFIRTGTPGFAFTRNMLCGSGSD